MALFKIVRGKFEDLPKTYHDGYAYFCTDTGDFYIDYKENESSTDIKRMKISAGKADALVMPKDSNGNPVAVGSGTEPVYIDANGVPKATTYQLNATVPSDAKFTDTNTKVTSVSNHYTPAANSASQLSADAADGSSATWNSTNIVTGVNIQRDAKGHVVGVTVDSAKMPANPNVDTNTAHEHAAGVGLAIEGESNILSGEVKYKAKLKNETLLTVDSAAATTTSGRVYPVAADKSGYLAVNVPWTNVNSNYKTKQDAVSDPTANGTSTEFISSITQDANGVISATKKTVPTAPSSLKNPYSLTIQGNGTTLTNGTYDGSAAKTVNITPESIGAGYPTLIVIVSGDDTDGYTLSETLSDIIDATYNGIDVVLYYNFEYYYLFYYEPYELSVDTLRHYFAFQSTMGSMFFLDGESDDSLTINYINKYYLDSNSTITVSQGGTGKATHTSNAILTGNGTGSVKNVATANGAFYATSTNGAAKFGTLPVAQGGTGITSNPSMLVNLGSTTAASVFGASPRPGVTGTLGLGNGGTGATTWSAARQNMKIYVSGYDTLPSSFSNGSIIFYPI